MAGEATCSGTKGKRGRISRQESNRSEKSVSEMDETPSRTTAPSTSSDCAAVLTQSSCPETSDERPKNLNRGLRVFKIVVLGDGGVGKSAVTLQFVNHSFLDYHDPTIEDSYQKQAVIDGEPALLDILDTAGQVEFTAMRDQYMRCGEGFLICYSVTDRHSFEEAVEYRKLIQKVRAAEDTPIVLVANKFDLHLQRKVTTEEGLTLARQIDCPFFETSAALRSFIDDAFHSLVREIRKRERHSIGVLTSEPKSHKNSKWWRLRSIFALVFKRKRHYTPSFI